MGALPANGARDVGALPGAIAECALFRSTGTPGRLLRAHRHRPLRLAAALPLPRAPTTPAWVGCWQWHGAVQGFLMAQGPSQAPAQPGPPGLLLQAGQVALLCERRAVVSVSHVHVATGTAACRRPTTTKVAIQAPLCSALPGGSSESHPPRKPLFLSHTRPAHGIAPHPWYACRESRKAQDVLGSQLDVLMCVHVLGRVNLSVQLVSRKVPFTRQSTL